jgi:hypothetical protein
MDALEARINRRARITRETAEVAVRVNPQNNPSLEEIARFHELHARHERELGREDTARAAEERARRARALAKRRS